MYRKTLLLMFPFLVVCMFSMSMLIAVAKQQDNRTGDTAIKEQIHAILERLDQYETSGDVGKPLMKQLGNRAEQALHQLEKGSVEQAEKKIEDFVKHLRNDAMQKYATEEARQQLERDANHIMQQLKRTSDSTITIVDNGESRAVVLLPEQADDRTRNAASELAEYVEKATGAVFPVMTEAELGQASPPLTEHAKIYIGYASPQHSSVAEELNGMNGDGFILDGKENSIAIIGPTSWGNQFGVYEFLERYVGVRWLLPGPDGEDVPHVTTLSIPLETVKQEPASIFRKLAGTRGSQQEDWYYHSRMHQTIEYMHNLYNLFPPSKYGTTNPEFYPKKNGLPSIPTSNVGWQPCFTAPGIVEEAIRNINAYFAEHPEEQSYSLGINDSGGFCEADPAHPDYPNETNSIGKVNMSDIYYSWVNQVVEGVLQTYPDKYFGLLAYDNVFDPPTAVKLHPRAIPFITDDRMSWGDAELGMAGKQFTEQWHEAADHLGWYEYLYGTPYLVPRVYFHQMADNYKFGYENGVVAHTAELYPNWGEGPKPWVSAKLQWNPLLDVDDLLQEWYERAVGPEAAPYLAAYYDHWEQFWSSRIFQTDWFQEWAAPPRPNYMPFDQATYLAAVTPQDMAQSRSWLESAVQKAGTAQQKARANLMLRAFEYYEASALSYPKQTTVMSLTYEAEANQYLDDVLIRLRQGEYRLQLVEQFKNDPVLLHPITPQKYHLVWNNGIEAATLAQWVRVEPVNGSVQTRIADLAVQSDSAGIRTFAKMVLAMAGKGTPLLLNPSFETGGGSDPNLAPPWWYWYGVTPGTKIMYRSDLAARTGQYGLLTNLSGGGPVQEVPITAGQYGASAYFYMPPGVTSNGTINLSGNLMDENRKVISSNYISSTIIPVSASSGTWIPLTWTAQIPAQIGGKEVKNLQLVVRLLGQTGAETVFIDDVDLYKLD